MELKINNDNSKLNSVLKNNWLQLYWVMKWNICPTGVSTHFENQKFLIQSQLLYRARQEIFESRLIQDLLPLFQTIVFKSFDNSISLMSYASKCFSPKKIKCIIKWCRSGRKTSEFKILFLKYCWILIKYCGFLKAL